MKLIARVEVEWPEDWVTDSADQENVDTDTMRGILKDEFVNGLTQNLSEPDEIAARFLEWEVETVPLATEGKEEEEER